MAAGRLPQTTRTGVDEVRVAAAVSDGADPAADIGKATVRRRRWR
jgi:hypothetical protein